MLSIQNDLLIIQLIEKGAELQSIVHKDNKLEYLWNGDPAFWGKHSPVLFPIIGTLRNNEYIYNNKTYNLGRHGFAREKTFTVTDQEKDQIRFMLRADAESRTVYPFEFEFSIIYSLNGNQLSVQYEVKNAGPDNMYFSVGGHPAFKLPLVEGTGYDDYFLEFNEEETKPRWPISKDGLIELKPITFLKQTDQLPLTKSLFSKDAIVLKFPTSSIVSLKSEKTSHGLDFNFAGFPYLGLWAAPNADFLCIEPWCGIADSVDADQQLIHKEGIETLAPGKSFSRTWSVSLF